MKILYLEPFSGLSGDMLNGLLLDLGGDLEKLKSELLKLGVGGYHLHAERREKSSIYGVDFDVHMDSGEKDTGIPGDFSNNHAHLHLASHNDPQPSDKHPHLHSQVEGEKVVHEHAHYHVEEEGHAHEHFHSHVEGAQSVHEHEHLHAEEHEHAHLHATGEGHPHEHHHHHGAVRGLKEIFSIIDNSQLSDEVKQHSRNVFYDIAKAEAAVHQKSIEEIHFHEVGAIDSIVDVIGFFIQWEQLGIEKVYATPVTEGSGTIKVAHGVMPVPVPAVMQLRKETNIPVHQDFDIHTELVTPTGLAIFKEIAPEFIQVPANTYIEKVGYGFGKRDTGKFNALRGSLLVQKHSSKEVFTTNDHVLKIETNIDDQTPEQLGFVMDVLFENGALDVFYTPVHMKKNRCGILLTVLTTPDQKEKFTTLLFKHTSTIGVRYGELERTIMRRSFEKLTTPFGEVTLKINEYQGIVKKTIEYADCEKIALENDLSITEVYTAIQSLL